MRDTKLGRWAVGFAAAAALGLGAVAIGGLAAADSSSAYSQDVAQTVVASVLGSGVEEPQSDFVWD
ncbi:MAG: hypothetical protein HKP61_10975 [Dactylosporangium sp.]|nr:hypothetical protein [Dactylosporangium sp.]NNJ61449.1 hypothetical protein [Dactylosporangium sp.]